MVEATDHLGGTCVNVGKCIITLGSWYLSHMGYRMRTQEGMSNPL